MELWDLLDERRRPTGQTHPRGAKIPPGRYHLVVGVWAVNHAGELLVTLRDPSKEDYPNSWENTGGSALAGETSRQAAARELLEETGISVGENDLAFLCEAREDGLHAEGGAFVDCWFAPVDTPIADVTLQPGETVDARWVSVDTFEAMIAVGEVCKPVANRYWANRERIRGFCDERKRAGALGTA